MAELTTLTQEDVLEALRLWHGGDRNSWPLENLRLGLQLKHQQHDHSTLAEVGFASLNRAILNQGLKNLRLRSPEAEDLLRERFENRRDVLSVANSLNISESSLYYRQRQAVQLLTEILLELEAYAGNEWQERMLARLIPSTYQQLIGIETAEQVLIDIILEQSGSHIVSLDGLGGIGKTAMADHLVRQLIKTPYFDEICWVTAKHTHLSSLGRLQIESGRPALTFPMLIEKLAYQLDLPDNTHLERQRQVRQILKEHRCLVVVDNLETVADYRSLLPELQQLQNPTKFLLTSRIRLLQQSGVYSYSLTELSKQDAIKLMRQEAKQMGLMALSDVADADLGEVYEIVGGNPLALKLIVGQLRVHSLPRILQRFGQPDKRPFVRQDIFNYIYEEIWQNLDDTGKTTLLALTQAGESGFNFDHLVEITGLDEQTVINSIEELIQLSLVDLSGTLFDRRYCLHRLTEVFLMRMFTGD